jgi:hypothetical protein
MLEHRKVALSKLDVEIAQKRAEVEESQLKLRHLVEGRRAFALRFCGHEKTYERSCMGSEVDTYCDICGESLP